MVATFRESDSNPKERFVWHNAGMNGKGNSSYIDACVLRDRDINSGWTATGDGTLEERVYYGQNWRADVSVVLSDTGTVKEWVKYSSYGVPFSITPADFNADGFVNGTDDDDFDIAYNGGAGAWDARVDLDLSGTLTSADDTLFTAEFVAGEAGGYRVLSRASLANRLGYAGYQHAPELAKTRWHVRHRVLDSETGRWLTRDPLPVQLLTTFSNRPVRLGVFLNHDVALFMYLYANTSPIVGVDPLGLLPSHCVTYYYNSIQHAKDGGLQCRLKLRSDIQQCCSGQPSTPPSVACIQRARQRYLDCVEANPPPPPPPGTLPARLPPGPGQPSWPPYCGFEHGCYFMDAEDCEECCIQSCHSNDQDDCGRYCPALDPAKKAQEDGIVPGYEDVVPF